MQYILFIYFTLKPIKIDTYHHSNKPTFDKTFKRISIIGEGAFGKVYKVCHKHDNELYALKEIIAQQKELEL